MEEGQEVVRPEIVAEVQGVDHIHLRRDVGGDVVHQDNRSTYLYKMRWMTTRKTVNGISASSKRR